MIKCQNCGTFVPAEKAFCPNCSEPMEVEEKSNRNHSFSSDMMSTIRDDPEKYRWLLRDLTKKKKQQKHRSSPAPKQVSTPAAAAPQPPPPPPVAAGGRPAVPRVA